MNVILIAGLGPALMETEDLAGSLYDQDRPEIRRQYDIGGRDCTPERLIYQSRGRSIPLLRPRPKLRETDYISETLKSILSAEGIPFHFIPIRQIWANQAPDTRGLEGESIVCLSTTFMWNERMLDHAISWVFRHLHCRYLVVGGQYGVLKQEYLLQHWGAPNLFLQTGEAELSLVPLIRALQTGGDEKELLAIPNLLSIRDSGTLLRTATEDFDFRSVPRVRFCGQSGYIPYMSMRGCPYRCKFCALRECTPKWQYQTAERIFADWQAYAKENDANHFSINDSTFFIPYHKIPRLLELLKQPLYQPMPVSRQAVLLYIGTNGLLDEVPVEQVRDFAVQFVDRMEHQYVELMEEIQSTGNLSGVAVETIRAALADYKKEKLPGN